MTQNIKRTILLVGVGRHATRIYLPLLNQLKLTGDVDLAGVIELASQQEHVKNLLGTTFLTTKYISIPDESANDHQFITETLSHLLSTNPFDSMLIASDPRHRDAYFDFAIDNKIDVFVDKPIFALDDIAHDPIVAEHYLAKLERLNQRIETSKISFVVQAQRRDHVGYQFIKSLVDESVQKFDIPVTSLHIQHADGMWVLPDEWEREHHPYKYGFGKLFHSGYHFVDLMSFLLQSTLTKFNANEVEAAVKAKFPKDSLNIWEDHALLPHNRQKASKLSRSGYGEHDIYALLDFRSDQESLCIADLALLQNSYSDRDPKKIVTDSYKGIGRVRHERVDLKLSSILNIQVHSYQSGSNGAPSGDLTGDTDHFDILLFKNTHFFAGKSYERLTLDTLSKGKSESNNEKARASLFKKFLTRAPTASTVEDHHLTSFLTGTLYRNMALSQGRMHVTCNPLPKKA